VSVKKNNTAIATTAIVKGRFAPSPTGPLHWGSLFTAIGSYCDAKHHGGRWYVRLEDLDRERSQARYLSEHPRVLEHFGLEWDGEIIQQSQRVEIYTEKINQLIQGQFLYACDCTRSQIHERALAQNLPSGRYTGTCRDKHLDIPNHILRFKVNPEPHECQDRLQGVFSLPQEALDGDFVIRRKDGTISYDLAVVVDDALMGITDVVRGLDLWPKTLDHHRLQKALGFPHPRTLHLPLLTDAGGQKLSKSKQAIGVDQAKAPRQLSRLLRLLGIPLPAELDAAPVREQIAFAVAHWDPQRLKGIKNIDLA